METTEKKEEKTPINIDVERKREVISFQVSPTEKREITYKAIKECGISVSEFIRTKIFMEPKKNEAPEVIEKDELLDEERLIYEEKLIELNAENKKLRDQIISDKVLKTELKADNNEIGNPTIKQDENSVLISLEPQFKALLDKIKGYRDEKLSKLDEEDKQKHYDFNTFLKVMFLRGVKRSYFNSDLKNSTGLGLDDFEEIIEITGIREWDI